MVSFLRRICNMRKVHEYLRSERKQNIRILIIILIENLASNRIKKNEFRQTENDDNI
jgi:hypothetical protein